MILSSPINGVYAALLTPRKEDRSVDVDSLRALVGFLRSKDISSFAVNGATGEFCLTTPGHLRAILETVRGGTASPSHILCGIGAAGSSMSIELAAIAESASADGLLLPMPYFFPYAQQDLEGFCREVAASTQLPILLYNLPQFTSGLEMETVRRLVEEVPNIIGIKDSSNSPAILRDLTRNGPGTVRMVGNDSMLAGALEEGICDGVVSGVACVMPELMTALYEEREDASATRFRQASKLVSEFADHLNAFPTPWGLKWIAEARGLAPARFAQPVSELRAAQGRSFVAWAAAWFASAMAELGIPGARFDR